MLPQEKRFMRHPGWICDVSPKTISPKTTLSKDHFRQKPFCQKKTFSRNNCAAPLAFHHERVILIRGVWSTRQFQIIQHILLFNTFFIAFTLNEKSILVAPHNYIRMKNIKFTSGDLCQATRQASHVVCLHT